MPLEMRQMKKKKNRKVTRELTLNKGEWRKGGGREAGCEREG